MKLVVVAVGQRVPAWTQAAWDEYAKRFPPELRVELKAVKTEARASKTLATLLAAERERIAADEQARFFAEGMMADADKHAKHDGPFAWLRKREDA